MLEYLEISKKPVKDHLLRFQDIFIAHSNHLRDTQTTHKKFPNCNNLDSTPERSKFQVGYDHVQLLETNCKDSSMIPCNEIEMSVRERERERWQGWFGGVSI